LHALGESTTTAGGKGTADGWRRRVSRIRYADYPTDENILDDTQASIGAD
jgi:hypothetical protein